MSWRTFHNRAPPLCRPAPLPHRLGEFPIKVRILNFVECSAVTGAQLPNICSRNPFYGLGAHSLNVHVQSLQNRGTGVQESYKIPLGSVLHSRRNTEHHNLCRYKNFQRLVLVATHIMKLSMNLWVSIFMVAPQVELRPHTPVL